MSENKEQGGAAAALLRPRCEMEESGSQKLVWDGDAKAVQQCLTDIFTSVYTTCDIPENAIFGPCVLSHTSLYDSIAFIALKSTDKRTAPYIFRVRPPKRGFHFMPTLVFHCQKSLIL